MITFFVAGVPSPQGSSRAFVVKGRPVITSMNKNLGDWKRLMADTSQAHACMHLGPIKLNLGFVMPRPASLPKKTMWHVKRPDLDKLVRAACDAFTGIMWKDDSQIVNIEATKSYAMTGESTGVNVEIVPLS